MPTHSQQPSTVLSDIRNHIITHDAMGQDVLLTRDWQAFERRLTQYLPTLLNELDAVYGAHEDLFAMLNVLMASAWTAYSTRAPELKAQDAQREEQPDWFLSNQMVGGVCYVDLFAGDLQGIIASIPYFKELGLNYLHLMPLFRCPEGKSDGGYAVSSYREVNPALGTMADLHAVAQALRKAGIVLVVDFIFNHTSNEHEWARGCMAGDARYADFYYVYPDRTVPDVYDVTVREIFPDQHAGAFSQLADGRWVWTTFNSFQWDLNYSNPWVLNAMAGEMLFIANLGVDVLRMDAVAFIWKQLGTDCENLPQAHALIRAFNAVLRIAAPSVLFKSEAIVHPDKVVQYISPSECQLSYNPLQMALLWNTLATREVNLLQQALTRRHHIPANTAWVNYVRCHDDIGWTFSDEDAAEFGINGYTHRQFLNRFYVNRFEGSFARGVPFQDNPQTGDCRISGMCASLVGLAQHDVHAVARILLLHSVILSTGGLPLIYLGDEVGTLNDEVYLQDASKHDDSRWVHRPMRDDARYAQRYLDNSEAGQIYQGLRQLIQTRQNTSAFAGGALTVFDCHNPHVLGYQRGLDTDALVLVLCNFSEFAQTISALTLSAMPAQAVDIITRNRMALNQDLVLSPYQVLWLQIQHRNET